MGYRAYHVTTKFINRGEAHEELIDKGCTYAAVKCYHYICSAYAPSVETTPIEALENVMSNLDQGKDSGDGEATWTNEEIDEFIKYLKEEYDNGEHDGELNAVLLDLEAIKKREGGEEYNTITFF